MSAIFSSKYKYILLYIYLYLEVIFEKETIIYSPYKLSDIMIVSPFWASCWGVETNMS